MTRIKLIFKKNKLNNSSTNLPAFQVLKKFRQIYGSVRQHFREIEQTCGVSGSQLWILQEIANTPGVGVSEVAQRLSIHQSTCSQLVEKLVNRNLIIKERSKVDQRRVGLILPEATLVLLSKAPSPIRGVLPEALMQLPEEILVTLDASLQNVINQLQIHDDKYSDKHLADM
jgi:DNA-binding MarR family transcriptional regulator